METHSNADLIVISIVAKPGAHFAGYDLLQAITAAKMQFGPMNIFHYYISTASKVPLFSLASITEPGEFDWDRMGDYSCSGLTLFMDLKAVSDPEEAFAIMVATAEQLADDLEGELCAGQHLPWDEETQRAYENKIMNYSRVC